MELQLKTYGNHKHLEWIKIIEETGHQYYQSLFDKGNVTPFKILEMVIKPRYKDD